MNQTMAYSWKFVLLYTILLCQSYPINTGSNNKKTKTEVQPPIPVKDLAPELMTPIFEVMRSKGEYERDKVDSKINQYLLITIVSDNEIKQAKNWEKSFPTEFIFLLNERDHGRKNYNPGRELHGEVISIHFGKIQRLMDKFKNNPETKNKYPIMLLYSHYIPCAHVHNLGYSCSEELMNYAKGRIQEFIMLVAYTTFYKGTSVKDSFDFMKSGGINAFQHMIKGPYEHKLKVYSPSSIDGIKKTFQGEAYDCIIDFPPSKCCTGSEKNRAAITTYFINYVTYQCIAYSNAARLFTELSKNQLKSCLKREIDKNIGDDCIHCSKKNPLSLKAAKALFEFCFDRSLEVSQGLGKPFTNVYDPDWVPCPNCKWNEIYNAPGPKKDKMKLARIVCANRVNSLESLCSAYKQKEQNKKSSYSEAFNKWQLTQNFAKP